MIIIEVGGGLGNQMFGYAFARSLALKEKDDLYISDRLLKNDKLRNYSLNHFNLSDEVGFVDDNKKLKLIHSFRYFLSAVFGKLKIKCKNSHLVTVHNTLSIRKYVNIPYKKKRINIYRGIFQSSRYFDSIRASLVKEFTTKDELTEEETKIEKMIKKSESVCLHVRRGDFLSSSIHDVCTVDYFNNAVKLMSEKKKGCKFFVFSDDIEWTKENILGDNMVYMDNNSSEFVDLHLMSKCKNFIIPNSTFSWWAQYLSESEDKVVIAPSIWLKDEGEKENGVYMDDWLCIKPF